MIISAFSPILDATSFFCLIFCLYLSLDLLSFSLIFDNLSSIVLKNSVSSFSLYALLSSFFLNLTELVLALSPSS
ncbi:unnamed protein product [Blepharisma stoltei]|uniref:Uncharacterized protein n=1 Tax=Blepharisma stoltei TaxID=1481888 RepID=A0AAU9JP61_9CILI|nr:unnamed protein product [Blepharisma stoltei]